MCFLTVISAETTKSETLTSKHHFANFRSKYCSHVQKLVLLKKARMWYSIFDSSQVIRILLLCDNANFTREHQFEAQVKVTSLLGSITLQRCNSNLPKRFFKREWVNENIQMFCKPEGFITVATSPNSLTFYFR